MSDTEYGLAGLRDADGELQTVDHTYQWAGEEVTIRFDPPTLSQQEELESLDDDEPVEEMEGLLDTLMVKPSTPEDGSWTAREMQCYLQGIIAWSLGQEDGLAQEVQDEIDDRTDAEGN